MSRGLESKKLLTYLLSNEIPLLLTYLSKYLRRVNGVTMRVEMRTIKVNTFTTGKD